jgi:DNA-binding HxlR family transcriptional regulator
MERTATIGTIARELAALDEPQARRPAECPVEDWLAFLGHRWNALALWHLNTGPKRHGDLLDLLPGVTPKVLSERLTALEARGLIKRMPLPTFPRSVTYSLTASGSALVAILDKIEVWAKSAARTPVGGDV